MFNIREEVWDDTGKFRIDLIITCKSTGAVFGVECKKPGFKRGSSAGKIVMQCIRYSLLRFNGKRLPIFLVPALSKNEFVCPVERIDFGGIHIYKDKHHNDINSHHTFNGFVGEFNVGEVKKISTMGFRDHYEFTFLNKIIYSTQITDWLEKRIKGLNVPEYEKLLLKIEGFESKSGLKIA